MNNRHVAFTCYLPLRPQFPSSFLLQTFHSNRSTSTPYYITARTTLPPKPIKENTHHTTKPTRSPPHPNVNINTPNLSQLSSTSSSSISPPSTLINFIWPRALLLVIAAVWGTNFATVKLLQTGPSSMSISTAALARFSLAAVAMLPFVFVEICGQQKNQPSTKPRLPAFPKGFLSTSFGIGLTIFSGYFTQSISLGLTEANKSAFICSLAVVAVPMLEWFLQMFGIQGSNETSNESSNLWITWGAPLLAVVGVAMLELGGSSTPCSGDIWAMGQPIGFAMGFILNQRAAARFPHLVFSLSAMQLIITAALSAAWALIDTSLSAHTLAFPHISDAFSTPQNIMAIVYAGLITTALTVWLENIALAKVSAGELAVLLSTEPFWAAAFSSVILSEHMGTEAMTGGVVILAACLLNQLKHVNLNFSPLKKMMTPVGTLSVIVEPIKSMFDGIFPPSV